MTCALFSLSRCKPHDELLPPENPIFCHHSNNVYNQFAIECCRSHDFCNRNITPTLAPDDERIGKVCAWPVEGCVGCGGWWPPPLGTHTHTHTHVWRLLCHGLLWGPPRYGSVARASVTAIFLSLCARCLDKKKMFPPDNPVACSKSGLHSPTDMVINCCSDYDFCNRDLRPTFLPDKEVTGGSCEKKEMPVLSCSSWLLVLLWSCCLCCGWAVRHGASPPPPAPPSGTNLPVVAPLVAGTVGICRCLPVLRKKFGGEEGAREGYLALTD